MNEKKSRSSFSGTLGFVMAAAGSAVGLGNIWRFPYLAAKDGGGLFLLCYIILALTFGFALLTTEISIGRMTAQSPLTAYGKVHPKWKGIGIFACLVPIIILPYYCTIGGWVFKYFTIFATGKCDTAAQDGFFTGFITSDISPIVFGLIFLAVTAIIIFAGVDKGIERYSKVLMPALLVLIIGIAIYCLTISYTDADGVTRTGVEGFLIYVLPDFSNITFKQVFITVLDALGQLFYSISVAMGIMVTYGSYVKKDVNLMNSINQIEFFDTLVAFLAGMMIVPAVYVFMGREGMSGGPGLMFVSLPKVFHDMGGIGIIIGILFFIMVSFAAITSSVSIMEAIVSSLMDKFGWSRNACTTAATVYAAIVGTIVCLGYNKLYFELPLPNGAVAQILDVMDYISNYCLMPIVALLTCVLIGWVVKPKTIIDEVTQGHYKFHRRVLYIVMVKFIAPVLLFVLLLQATGILQL